MTATDRYRDLRSRVDHLADHLTQLHGPRLVCRPGCAGCCVDLTVFPVEYAAILEDLQAAGAKALQLNPAAACAFLQNNLCQIYKYRPIICRTHGLPIAFTNSDLAEPEISVSFCPLNFASIDLDEYQFGPDNTLDLDAVNTELVWINAEFDPSQEAAPPRRVPLTRLADDLK
jgi:uncharacterized protein